MPTLTLFKYILQVVKLLVKY